MNDGQSVWFSRSSSG